MTNNKSSQLTEKSFKRLNSKVLTKERPNFVAFALFGIFLIFFVLFSSWANAAVTKVGNGDNGRDLEGFEKIESGKIIEARNAALRLLEKVNTRGIRGLGNLIPEVEKADLYMAIKDSSAIDDYESGKYHSNIEGLVYARTFAEPHAPTRFFPIANDLDERQLVALQIHEALHRALPKSVREDEDIVSKITLAITSPDATYDRVAAVSEKNIPNEVLYTGTRYYDDGKSASSMRAQIPDDATIKRPSIFRYNYKSFVKSKEIEQPSKYNSMHSVESYMYPFGSDENPIGVGVALSLLRTESEETELGPLAISGRSRVWSTRGFDVGVWGELALNTLSAEELKNSPFGRDVFSAGLSMRKDTSVFYVENILGVALPGKTKQKIGNLNYEHEFGSLTTARVRVGGKTRGFALGGFGEILLSDYYRVTGGEFKYDSGRFNIISAGPEMSFSSGNFTVSMFGRFIVSRTKDASYDSLGYLFGAGTKEGFIGGSLALNL